MSAMKDLKSRFVVEEEIDESNKYGQPPLFLWQLTDTLEQLDLQVQFLAELLYKLAHEAEITNSSNIRILRSLNEVADHIYKSDGHYVMLTSPKYMPVVFRCQDRGWVKDAHDFANWLMINWRDESLVIVLS